MARQKATDTTPNPVPDPKAKIREIMHTRLHENCRMIEEGINSISDLGILRQIDSQLNSALTYIFRDQR